MSRHRPRRRKRPRARVAFPLLGALTLLVATPLLVVVRGVGQVETASAQPVPVAFTTPLAARGGTDSVTAPGRRAVRLQRASELAASAYQAARDRARGLDEHAASLAERAAEAAELTAQASRRADAQDDLGVVDALEELYSASTPLDAAADAAANQAHAAALADQAREAAAAAQLSVVEAGTAWRRAEQRAADVQLADTARSAARTAIALASFGRDYHPGSGEQDRLNRRALVEWHEYLRDLAAAEVVPPVASVLADPAALPAPYRPFTRHGKDVPGLALVDRFADSPLVVVPAETVEAVSRAFRLVGTREPALSSGVGPAECGGLVQTSWEPAGLTIAADSGTQLQSLAPVPNGRAVVGDVLFLGDEASGLRSSTIRLADDLMIALDPATGRVRVERVERRDVLASARVAAPAPTTPISASPGCGTPLTTDVVPVGGGLWSAPLGADEGIMTAGYGDSGGLWSSGFHTGQDFAAPVGTPVQAMRGGVVTIEHPAWAGNLVRVDHGGGVETVYAHLATITVADGDEVEAGTQIGTVGTEGNSTGPHLHLELRLDGEAVDPLAVLDPVAAAATTDDYANGELPGDVLCMATPAGGLLRCDAAVSLRLLAAAYEADLGEELCLTDTYRSRAGQLDVASRKPTLAAAPGTSMHGWGVAVDVCGGAESFGTAEHDLLVDQGPTYGWVQPGWAQSGGSKPEPWHFEFVGASQG